MSSESRDRELGMRRKITRRDFLDGAAMAVAGAALGLPGATDDREADPPELTGLRGDQAQVFEYAHRLRDGKPWDSLGAVEEDRESCDLVVVGAGISGLAAAHFYRRHAGPEARILILDPHDDFGGHARRNEFMVGGRLLLANGAASPSRAPARTARSPSGCLPIEPVMSRGSKFASA